MAQEGLDKGAITMRELAAAPATVIAGQGSIFVKNTSPSTLAFVGDDNAEHTVLQSGDHVLMSGMANASGSYIGQYQASGNYLDSSQVFLSGVAGISGDYVGRYVVSGTTAYQASGIYMTSATTVSVVSGMDLSTPASAPRAGSIQYFGNMDVTTQSGSVLPLVHVGDNWMSGNVSTDSKAPSLNVTSATVMARVDGFYQAHFDAQFTAGNVAPMSHPIGIGVVSASGVNAIVLTDLTNVQNKYTQVAVHAQLPLLSGQAVVPIGASIDGNYTWNLKYPHLSLHELK